MPKKSNFCHLHCHSEYSSLDGGSRVTNMPEKLKDLGMSAMALTDHGVMQGLPEFQATLKEAGIKPILGLEAYLTPDRHNQERGTPTWHITLIAENNKGYSNLCKISSFAFIEGTIKTFGRPRARADWEILEKYSEGIICLTGCMAGPVMSALMHDGSITKARQYTEKLIEIFGKENVYGEIQNVGITVGIPKDSEIAKLLDKKPLTAKEAEEFEGYHGDFADDVTADEVTLSQSEANRILVEEVCKPLGIKYVATGDVHYLEEDDAMPHDAMICIGTGQIQRGKRRFSLLPKKYHMRSEEEMREALPDYPEALEWTMEIADRCDAEISYGKELLPRFPIPDGFADSKEYLRHLCEEGVKTLYPAGHPLQEEAGERLDYELSVIDKMGYNDYFLIVWDLFREARERNIPAGPGRGSAAGAIVAYSLGITQICPLEYGLLFERFLNPDRISMPDIDMDFGPSRRGELMEYARDKYNDLAGCETAVAQQVTFSRYKAKGAIRDSARVLADADEDARKDALKVGDRLAGIIPHDPSATMRSVWEGAQGSQPQKALQKAYKAGGFQKNIIKQAGWLEGLIRAYGLHAAAVLIADHDLSDDLPLQKFGSDDKHPLHVQYEMNWAESLGLLKMDFLGLRNLEVIQDAIDKIHYVHGVDLDPYNIPIDDKKTYDLFASGETIGTFQFESGGMQGALREVQPTELRDLIAIVALYRPGPMAHIPHYAARKAGREEVVYLHPKLEAIQGETYGITVYQEQSMLVARELAGFTPGEADDLRKAIGKKLHDKMAALKPKFLKGCAENDVAKEVAEELWKDNEAAADYSFNKSHAACYAYVSYITGYLKANYPNEYMAALLSSVMGDKDKAPLYLTEAKRMGLKVLPPDINRSLKDFAVLEDEENPGEFDILFGLTALKKVGTAVVKDIIDEREKNGPFSSMNNLIRRMPGLSKGVVEALVLGGALDSLGGSRKVMYENVEEIKAQIKKEVQAEEREWKSGVKKEAEKDEKLSTMERRGVEAAALLAMRQDALPDDNQLSEVIAESLMKENLRSERAEARKRAKEDGLDPKSEESKIRVESEAVAAVEKNVATRENTLEKVLEKSKTSINAYLSSREDIEDGLEMALAEETDTNLTGPEWEETEKLNREREVLGVYVSGHPLDSDAKKWAHYVDQGLGNINDTHIGQTLRVAGALVGKTEIKTKTGKSMFRLVFEDLTGNREAIAWQEAIEGYEPLLDLGQVVAADVLIEEDRFQQAKQEEAEDAEDAPAGRAVRMTISKMYRWDPSKIRERAKPLIIEIPENKLSADLIKDIEKLCAHHPGDHPVKVVVGDKQKKTKWMVDANETLKKELAILVN
jgi:DNA polymerase-3 subunit alpha